MGTLLWQGKIKFKIPKEAITRRLGFRIVLKSWSWPIKSFVSTKTLFVPDNKLNSMSKMEPFYSIKTIPLLFSYNFDNLFNLTNVCLMHNAHITARKLKECSNKSQAHSSLGLNKVFKKFNPTRFKSKLRCESQSRWAKKNLFCFFG